MKSQFLILMASGNGYITISFGREACGQEGISLRNKNNKSGDAAAERVLDLWQRMYREGAEFFVDGETVLPKDAVSKAVREDGAYMTDYVLGEAGKVEQVRLNKVHSD